MAKSKDKFTDFEFTFRDGEQIVLTLKFKRGLWVLLDHENNKTFPYTLSDYASALQAFFNLERTYCNVHHPLVEQLAQE